VASERLWVRRQNAVACIIHFSQLYRSKFHPGLICLTVFNFCKEPISDIVILTKATDQILGRTAQQLLHSAAYREFFICTVARLII
jgi:hypothetical protein